MHLALRLHPDSVCPALAAISAEILRPRAGSLVLRYQLAGDITALALLPPGTPQRADKLWEHTCFEAFLGAPDGAYREFNFAPSTEWAAYDFTGYRNGMNPAQQTPPRIETRGSVATYELQAHLDIAGLSLQPRRRLALSAVIEDRSGAKSYWALAHPPGKPDFHHANAFAYEFPGMEET